MRQPDDYTEQEAAEIESGIEALQDMSDTEIFKCWHKERMGHPLGVQLGISAVKELEDEVGRLAALLNLIGDEYATRETRDDGSTVPEFCADGRNNFVWISVSTLKKIQEAIK